MQENGKYVYEIHKAQLELQASVAALMSMLMKKICSALTSLRNEKQRRWSVLQSKKPSTVLTSR